jgi:lysophospholipase L1-like esterase
MLIEDGALVLFQGDSITDCGRDRQAPESLGCGYAMVAAGWFGAMHPERGVRFLNRGIGGNKVGDLRRRWAEDCLALEPTWLSIMIGINDMWPRQGAAEGTSAQEFEADYRHILGQVRGGPGSRLILCEPFHVAPSSEPVPWRGGLDAKIDVVRRLAREFGAELVPLDGPFARACTLREPAFWAPDGVHPTAAGHALIAREWLRAVGAL